MYERKSVDREVLRTVMNGTVVDERMQMIYRDNTSWKYKIVGFRETPSHAENTSSSVFHSPWKSYRGVFSYLSLSRV